MIGAGVYLAVATAFLGAAASLYLGRRLCRLSMLVGDRGLCIGGGALWVYAVGLLVEALGLLHAAVPLAHGHQALGRPELVERLLAGRGVLLASPFYAVSYTLSAVAIYVSHMEVDGGSRLHAAVPLIVQLYFDFNLVLLALLAAALAGTLRYGRPGAAGPIYYGMLILSHAAALLLPYSGAPELVYVSTMLRGAAPLALLALSGGR